MRHEVLLLSYYFGYVLCCNTLSGLNPTAIPVKLTPDTVLQNAGGVD